MNEASEYRVIDESTQTQLEAEVNRHLALGWVLVGGVSCMTTPGNYQHYCQAMTKRKDSGQR